MKEQEAKEEWVSDMPRAWLWDFSGSAPRTPHSAGLSPRAATLSPLPRASVPPPRNGKVLSSFYLSKSHIRKLSTFQNFLLALHTHMPSM